MTKSRIFLIITFVTLTLGFRASVLRWHVNPWDYPYLFVRVCDGQFNTPFSNNFPAGDPLFGQSLTRATLIKSVIDDINNLETTYITLELYPDDPSSPPPGSNYTAELADQRIIDVCAKDPSLPTAGGITKLEIDGKWIIGCDIKIKQDRDEDAKEWHMVFAHELGHCLGLNHPQELTDSIMSYFRDSEIYRYQIDDLMGITHIYPNPDLDLKENPTMGLSCDFK